MLYVRCVLTMLFTVMIAAPAEGQGGGTSLPIGPSAGPAGPPTGTPAAAEKSATDDSADAARTSFLEAARAVTASIQGTFYDEKTGLYAQSVTNREPEFMWGNGVMFSALVGAARHEPGTYRPVMERFFGAMDRYWDEKVKVPGYEPSPTAGDGHDKYYDDNQWMVIAFMEAWELTGEEKYLERARGALAFSLSGWDEELGGGIWWHEGHKGGSKNTCANGPAAVACLRVGRAREREHNVEWAKKLAAWTGEHLQDADGLFFDNQRVKDGHVNRGKLTYNSGLMVRANLGLYRATAEAKFLEEARRIGTACGAFVVEKRGAYRDAPRFSHLLLEADLELYRATRDAAYLERARCGGEAMLEAWRASAPEELIEQAATARALWLLADEETEVGRAFWKRADVFEERGAGAR